MLIPFKLNRKQEERMYSGGISIFRVVVTILLLLTGIRMLLKKRDQKKDRSGL